MLWKERTDFKLSSHLYTCSMYAQTHTYPHSYVYKISKCIRKNELMDILMNSISIFLILLNKARWRRYLYQKKKPTYNYNPGIITQWMYHYLSLFYSIHIPHQSLKHRAREWFKTFIVLLSTAIYMLIGCILPWRCLLKHN